MGIFVIGVLFLLLAAALIPVVLLYKNRSRLLREYREEKAK